MVSVLEGVREACLCTAHKRLDTDSIMQLTHALLCCAVVPRPAEDRKGVKEALVEMTKTSRAALQQKQ
jgi:hypothetical protein